MIQTQQYRRTVAHGAAEARIPWHPAPLSAAGGAVLPPRVRRALWLLLRGRAAEEQLSLDDLDRTRQAVMQSAAAVHRFLAERFVGPRFEAEVVSCLDVVRVLALTAPHDLEGCLDAIRALCLEIDRFLTLYDWVDDKRRLFEGLSPAHATTVTRLFRQRRSLEDMVVRLVGDYADTPVDGR